MLMLITLLNDGTLIAIGYDTVTPCKTLEKWNLRLLVTIGSVRDGATCVSSLLLLYFCLSSNDAGSLFQMLVRTIEHTRAMTGSGRLIQRLSS